MAKAPKEHCVVVVGAGFAGFNAARELSRLVGASTEIVLINSADYFLYVPLMPQVAGGLLEPRHIRVSLPRRLRNVRFVLGSVNHVDPRQKVVSWQSPAEESGQLGYDRLILTAGSVNKLLPIPGVSEYAHGFRTIAEAIYLRDHITRQLELAAGRRRRPGARGPLHLHRGRRGVHRHRGSCAGSVADHPARPQDVSAGRTADPVDAARHRIAPATRA
jgi:NADH dehydrogenase FAD-containing subunit